MEAHTPKIMAGWTSQWVKWVVLDTLGFSRALVRSEMFMAIMVVSSSSVSRYLYASQYRRYVHGNHGCRLLFCIKVPVCIAVLTRCSWQSWLSPPLLYQGTCMHRSIDEMFMAIMVVSSSSVSRYLYASQYRRDVHGHHGCLLLFCIKVPACIAVSEIECSAECCSHLVSTADVFVLSRQSCLLSHLSSTKLIDNALQLRLCYQMFPA